MHSFKKSIQGLRKNKPVQAQNKVILGRKFVRTSPLAKFSNILQMPAYTHNLRRLTNYPLYDDGPHSPGWVSTTSTQCFRDSSSIHRREAHRHRSTILAVQPIHPRARCRQERGDRSSKSAKLGGPPVNLISASQSQTYLRSDLLVLISQSSTAQVFPRLR